MFSQVTFLRKASLNAFAPIADLSAITRSGTSTSEEQDAERKESGPATHPNRAKVLGDEWTDHVIKVGRLFATAVKAM